MVLLSTPTSEIPLVGLKLINNFLYELHNLRHIMIRHVMLIKYANKLTLKFLNYF